MEESFREEGTAARISKINSAGLINLRIHNLWTDANNHSRKGKFLLWNADLDRVWCELSGDVEKKKKEEDEDDFDVLEKLDTALENSGPLKDWKDSDGFSELTPEDLKKKTAQYKNLMKKELFLRQLQNKQGKGTAYLDGSEDYMDG